MSHATVCLAPQLPPGWCWLPGHYGARASGPYGLTVWRHRGGFTVDGLHVPCSGVVPVGADWHSVCTNAQIERQNQIKGARHG